MPAATARRMEIETVILDVAADGPAQAVAGTWLRGRLNAPADAGALASRVRHVTTEVDAMPLEGWAELEQSGLVVCPSATTVETVQDKLAQRRSLSAAGLPVPDFVAWTPGDADAALRFGLPTVQKLRRVGYDGCDVCMLERPGDLARVLPRPSLLERRIRIRRGLSVLLARDPWGRSELRSIAEVEVVDGRPDVVRLPAGLSRRLAADLRIMSRRAAEAVDAVGVVAVEWMLDERGRPRLNEFAVRPHDSSHWTIEGATVCQFEPHLRAVLGWPLGHPEVWGAAAIANVISPPGLLGNGHPRAFVRRRASRAFIFTTTARQRLGRGANSAI